MSVAYAEAARGESAADVYLASSIEADAQTRREFMRLLGSVAIEKNGIDRTTSPEQVAAEQASLIAVVKDYFSHDAEKSTNGFGRLKADFSTNTFEILQASGHISQSHSKRRKDGFYQFGYSQRAMYAHGTRHAKAALEHRRRSAETLNELRIEEGDDAGRFRTHYLLEESRAPDFDDFSEAEQEELRKIYDTRTYKSMWRLTTVDEEGNRITYVAPVSGVDKAGLRHDTKGSNHVHEVLRTGLVGADATTALENAVWVSKELLPNGIVDIVRLNDEGIDGDAFFGVEGKAGDYDTIVEESLRREQQAENDVDAKVHELALAIRGMVRGDDCDAALLVMAHHAKSFAAELCVRDASYDASQFGERAACHIELARHHAQQGNLAASKQALQEAKKTAVVYMCGMRLEMDQDDQESDSGHDAELEDCDFTSKECPVCGEKNAKTKVRKGKYYHTGKGCVA